MSTQQFYEVVERVPDSKSRLPYSTDHQSSLPNVSRVLIPGPAILAAVGHTGVSGSVGWEESNQFFRKSTDGWGFLLVQPYEGYWLIMRFPDNFFIGPHEVLVCAFQRLPIWARTRDAAMDLAEFCDPLPPHTIAACWVDVDVMCPML